MASARAEEVGGIGKMGEKNERYKVSVMSQEEKYSIGNTVSTLQQLLMVTNKSYTYHDTSIS